MLEAAIAECEQISRETELPGGFTSDGVDHAAMDVPHAAAQQGTDGTWRVCVYFGSDAAAARSFEARFNNGGISVTPDGTEHTQPQTAVKNNPTVPQPAITLPDAAAGVADPDPTQMYHHFKPGTNPLWCERCDASEYAEQHI